MFQTDSDEDVIFVFEKSAPKFSEITFDQVKLLALQRDIDQESLPKQPAKPLTSQRSVAVERPVENVKMKTKEEKCEERLMKKEKKNKKGQASVPENPNCAVDDGGLVKVKKEKNKTKKIETVVIKEESWDGGGEKEEKKEKKKRRIVNESLNDANGSDVTDGNDKGVTKTKKKKLSHDENQVETAHNSVKGEEAEKKRRKEKKAKNKSVPIKQDCLKLEEEDEEEQIVKNEVSKKSKKGQNNILVVNNEEIAVQVKEKKKKKITVTMDEPTVTENKAIIAECGVKLQAEEEIHEVKVKKKKKQKVKTEDGGTEVETPKIKGNNKKSKASLVEDDNSMLNKKNKSTKSKVVITEEGQTKVKRKGKKEKGKKDFEEVSKTEETEPKKKKRKTANPKGEEEELLSMKVKALLQKDEQSTETPVTVAGETKDKKTKKKKSFVQVELPENDVRVETGAKKKKIKEEKVEDLQESPQVDVVFLSERSGNKDEITINQERRWALQMEIDKASQPEKPAKASGFGQWSTAQFNSSEQQQKFLRLMGSFKKGFQPAAVSTAGTNMAVGKDAQQQLQQKLLGEFERAHSRRMDYSNRGAGLGFTAPSSKKFSIDANARGSIRFDD